MKIPSFSRQTSADSAVEERHAMTTTQRDDRLPNRSPVATRSSTVTPPRDETTTRIPAARPETDRAASVTADRPAAVPDRHQDREHDRPRDRKPRASLTATLGLILGVAGALLVLSGPLAGYGIAVAALGLILSLAGLFATRKRHIAGKTDALLGALLSIGAIVLGILALTGALSWLGTDMHPASDLRQWLDTQFESRF